MNIGIIDIEPKIFNTAYMQIAAYHRGRGDTVEWWLSLKDRQFDHIYCSSLFDFTDKSEIPDRAICGGTGFDITSRLSVDIENCDLDYSLYPKCDRSIIWFSRGCIRSCPWCIVRAKEGGIRPTAPKNLNPNGEYIVVQDNNFFAHQDWRSAITELQKWGQPVDFQGVDARLLDKEMCEALLTLRHYKQIKIAWDNPREDLRLKLREITHYIKPRKLACYVLIGFNSTEEEDLYRIETLRNLGIDPYVMSYKKSDLYQKALARYVNAKEIFYAPGSSWKGYKARVSAQESAGCGWAK